MNVRPESLRRELGMVDATMMGLGSILGTGVFVSIGLAAGLAGPSIVLAIALAALVATCNALNSAQLAANLPVSGGSYEYGYHYLRPWLGFLAGWMFLCAKIASAATAALGFAGYLLHYNSSADDYVKIVIAVITLAILTLVVLMGIRPSSIVNIGIVSLTLISLMAFVIAGLPLALNAGVQHLIPILPSNFGGFFEATALMFVAYTGYGRIATLGEEVREPRITIPAAIITTLIFSAIVYIAVALIAIGSVGANELYAATQLHAAPLATIATQFTLPGIPSIVSIGAMTAMLGVLLNLILGLSRVLLAMGRRGDMPRVVTRLNQTRTTPYVSVIIISSVICCLIFTGNIKLTWSFSAFTVLIYYAVTNLAALSLPAGQRLYPRWLAWAGLTACLFLAFWVQWQVWVAGLVIAGIGLIWHWLQQSKIHRASSL